MKISLFLDAIVNTNFTTEQKSIIFDVFLASLSEKELATYKRVIDYHKLRLQAEKLGL